MNSRKRKSVEKPLCTYGASCYQKNPEHRKKFKHPPTKNKDENLISLNDVTDKISTEMSAMPVLSQPVTPAKRDSSLVNAVNSIDTNLEETVEEILKSMPSDFFDFWNFCCTVNKSNPQDAFLLFGYKLVGIYDLLAKQLHAKMKVDISCHWRYFYDPPEFQTVIQKVGKNLFHIGYFRDDPSEKPSILASNSAAVDEKLTLMGDNIFCAMNVELNKVLKTSNSKVSKSKASKLQELLLKFASDKKYSVNVQSSKTKQRQEKVVAKTFHGLGIVVPVKNGIGYRPIPDSNAILRKEFKRIATAENEKDRLEKEEYLDELISNIHFANDECDFGTGLELGIDLFCYGEQYFHGTIELLLSVAYKLLKRYRYALIIKAHLKNRKKGENLFTLKV